MLTFISFKSQGNNIFKSFEAKYKFDFSGLVAGKGILETKIDNNTYEVSFKGKTTSIVRWLYKLNVKLADVISIANDKDVYYKFYSKTSRATKKIFIKFKNATVATVNYEKNGKKETVKLHSNNKLYSPLNVYLFFITNTNYKFNKHYYRDIVISKKLYRVEITPLGIETIDLDIFKRSTGKRKALKAQLSFYELDKSGKLKQKNNVKKFFVWISLESPNIPLLIKMWHTIGFFEAKLVNLKVK